MSEIEIVISGGQARAIYNDALAPYVRALGGTIERATYVEPAEDGSWYVDLTRFGDGVVGGFATRQAALDWEVAWLGKNWLNSKPQRRYTNLRSGTCYGTPNSSLLMIVSIWRQLKELLGVV